MAELKKVIKQPTQVIIENTIENTTEYSTRIITLDNALKTNLTPKSYNNRKEQIQRELTTAIKAAQQYMNVSLLLRDHMHMLILERITLLTSMI